MEFLWGPPSKKRRTPGWKMEDRSNNRGVIYSKRPRTEAQVHELLKSLGVSDSDTKRVSMCLKAAIINGHVLLLPPKDDPLGMFGLDQVIAKGRCVSYSPCRKKVTCLVRDILYQPDDGSDYDDGGPNAPLHCSDECSGIYVTRLCQGTPTFDNGKFHNHCTQHSRFGYCIGDYHERHCGNCGGHYSGGTCSCGGSEEDSGSGSSDWEGSDSDSSVVNDIATSSSESD